MEFLKNNAVTVGLVALIALAGIVFAVRKAFTLGGGTGGVTGQPRPPQDPVGNMKPSRPPAPKPPPKEQV